MVHVLQSGAPKILEECTYPLTGKHCVDRIITEMGVFDVHSEKGELVLVEISEGVSVEDVKAATACPIEVRG